MTFDPTQNRTDTAPLPADVVAEMQRDMASGTPGPWTAEEKPGQKTAHGTASSIGLWAQHRWEIAFEANPDDEDEADDAAWLLGIWGEIGDEDRANARRIARLPDLEAGYLALSAQLAERDAECREAVMQSLASMGQAQEAYEAQVKAEAELARVTAERDDWRAAQDKTHQQAVQGAIWHGEAVVRAVDAEDTLATANRRIAALTEALTFYADKSGWNQPPVKTRDGLLSVEYENQASKIQRDRGAIARAALTTDKGAAS